MTANAPVLASRSRLRFLSDYVSERAWRMALRRRSGRRELEFYVLPGDLIGDITIASGLFEHHEIRALRALARSFRDRSGAGSPGVFVDVGANIGAHSVALARDFARVISVEPNPIVANILRANLAQNACGNATVLEIALGDRAGDATLFSIEKWNAGMASLVPVNGAERIATVRVELGDAVLAGHLPPDARIELIKIDVEGHEPSVLRGLKETLARHQPLLALEVRGAKSAAEIRGALQDTAYRHFYWLERPKRRAVTGPWTRLAELLLYGADIRLTPIANFEDTLYPMVIATTGPAPV